MLGLVSVVTLAASGASGALFWDGQQNDTGGNGTWDTNVANEVWDDGSLGGTQQAWVSGSAVVFAGTAGTVSVGANITVGGGNPNWVINTGGYTFLADGTNRTITIANTFRVDTADNNTATVGSTTAGQQVSLNLGGAGRVFDIADGDSLVLFNAVTNGALFKDGAGTMRLNNAASTYTGQTFVRGGLLLVNGSLSSQPGNAISINVLDTAAPVDSATLGGNGTILRHIGSMDGLSTTQRATISPGDPAITGGVGTLTVGSAGNARNVLFEDFSRLTIDLSGATSDRLVIIGDLTLSAGLDHDLLFVGTADGVTEYTLATYTGTLTGTFKTVTNLPTGYTLDYGTGSNSAITLVKVIPEPATLALLALGAGMMLGRNRRRRGN
ncbi:MAG: autotransporter-associated beta strand repeat-containing protein [Phycisphaeraceae bacterium]